MTLRIALLGPPIVEVDGAPLRVDTRKAVAMLAYLAEARGPVPRDTLSVLLWPEAPADRARASLRRTLSALGKGLGGAGLRRDRQNVALDERPELSVDTRRFDELAGSDNYGIEALAEAADLYRGDFMAGFTLTDSPEFDRWQADCAAGYRRTAAAVLERLSSLRAAHGHHAAAIDAATMWLTLDPLHEAAHRQLMQLHADAGDRTAALRQYRACTRILEDELSVAPLDETTALYHAIVEDRVRRRDRREPVARAQTRPAPGAPAFVGRAAALDQLARAYDAAASELTVVLIQGEPGIGKSRLIEHFTGTLDAPGPTVAVRSHQGEGRVAYGLAAETISAALQSKDAWTRLDAMPEWWVAESARLVPDLADLRPGLPEPAAIDSPGEHRRLLEGVGRLILGLCQGGNPGVLVLDDLQWADVESIEVVTHAVRRLRDERVLMVLAARSAPSTGGALTTLVREGSRAGVRTTVTLSRLANEDLRRLIKTTSPEAVPLTDELIRLSEGVPYVLLQYLTAAYDHGGSPPAVPIGVRELFHDRVAGVSDLARQLLSSASVVGRSFEFATLSPAAGRSEDETLVALEELLTVGLIRHGEATETFDFDHDLLRQFVYESTSPVRRRILHGRVADTLLGWSDRDDASMPARIASHLEAAGRDAQAAEQHLLAARRAAELYANHQAIAHYESALALGHTDGGETRAAIGRLQALSGNYGAALANLEAAAARAEGRDLGRLEHEIAVIHARAGEWEIAETRFAAAIEHLDDPAERSRLLADQAVIAHHRVDPRRARLLAGHAFDEAAQTDDPLAMAQAHNILGILERARDPGRARAHHETSLALVEDAYRSVRAAVLNNLALAYLASGEPEPGIGCAQEALAIVEHIGDRHKQAALHSNLADLLHAAGDEDAVAGHLTESAALFAEIGVAQDAFEPEIWMLTEW